MKKSVLMFIMVWLGLAGSAIGQVLIDGKNINDDKEIEYIQFSYYFESKKLSPVYSIDFGTLINDESGARQQKIEINTEEITSQMTPAYVLNKLHKAGWEYLGDALFMAAPMVENSQMLTLRRKKDN
jgi:tRNA G37 N-methylase Trm5